MVIKQNRSLLAPACFFSVFVQMSVLVCKTWTEFFLGEGITLHICYFSWHGAVPVKLPWRCFGLFCSYSHLHIAFLVSCWNLLIQVRGTACVACALKDAGCAQSIKPSRSWHTTCFCRLPKECQSTAWWDWLNFVPLSCADSSLRANALPLVSKAKLSHLQGIEIELSLWQGFGKVRYASGFATDL